MLIWTLHFRWWDPLRHVAKIPHCCCLGVLSRNRPYQKLRYSMCTWMVKSFKSSLQIMQMIHRHLRLVTLSLIVLEVLLWRHDVELSLRAVAWCQGRSHSQSVRLLGVQGQGRRDHQVTGTLEKELMVDGPFFSRRVGNRICGVEAPPNSVVFLGVNYQMVCLLKVA